MSIMEQYVHFFYLSACTMGAVMYGDMIPLTPIEQIFTFGAMFTARIYLAFLYAEAAAYLSSVNSAYSSRLKVKSTIGKNPELNSLSFDMKKRVYTYHEILGNNFKGVTESQVLNDLPESVVKQIKNALFKDLVNNITLFPKDDKSAIAALIWRLDLHLLSKEEYVIKDGEIADCMYFILRGKVEVSKDGVTLATLEQGAHFGEMALAEGKPTTRAASAKCITSCSVGSLSINNFNTLCEFYPIFKSKIQEEVAKRKKDLKNKTNKRQIKRRSALKNASSPRKSTFKKNSRTSNKGSRQSVYEVSEADDFQEKARQRLSVFEAPSERKSKRSSLISEEKKHLEQIKNQVNQILEHDESSKQNNPEQLDESRAPLVLQENPNMPDGEVIPNPNVYAEGDEEESERGQSSGMGSYSSRSSLRRKKNTKRLDGEAEIKISQRKLWWIREILRSVSITKLYEILVLLFVLYNLIFIPLQAGYRIEYSAGFITMEILTIVIYAFDIIVMYQKQKELKDEIQNQENNIEESDRHIQDFNILKKNLKWLRIRIGLSVVSIMPIAIVFQLVDLDEPLLIIFYLKCLRLVKLTPILRVFEAIKQRILNFGRIVEMLFLYYSACHIIACSFINIAYRQDDIRETWLRRLTVPQPTGIRTENNFNGLSDTTIYVHALEFTVNTVSHLAIGEITTINYRERIYNAFVIL